LESSFVVVVLPELGEGDADGALGDDKTLYFAATVKNTTIK
jgi:hypothetical protein